MRITRKYLLGEMTGPFLVGVGSFTVIVLLQQFSRLADLVILAPATANLIAKMAAGIADDYLTTILLATTAPVLVCPRAILGTMARAKA